MSVERGQPGQAPVYRRPPAKTSGRPTRPAVAAPLFDHLFFGVAAVCVLLLSVVYLRQGLTLSVRVLFLVGFWGLLSYLGLPRLHRVLSSVYVPDYFIGRTHTPDGLLGDPVNLALRGTAEQVHTALTRAGWVRADPITVRSSWRIVTGSVLRRSYPTAPVSSLLLFSRVQDFAYQQEVAGNPAQRHHVRFWATPTDWLLPGGHRVDWLAAGTYDRAVGLNLFTWQVTHKIDADIDVERDYIVDTVRHASPQVGVSELVNFSTGYHSRNGGGDLVRTDGDLPILELDALTPDPQVLAELAAEQPRLRHGVGARPPALLTGVLFFCAAIVGDFLSYIGPLVRSLRRELADLDPMLAVIPITVIAVMLAVFYLATGLLLWRTYVGGSLARFTLLFLLCGQVLVQLGQWVIHPDHSGLALATTSLYVLAIYALSSLTVRDWTVLKRQDRRNRRAALSAR